MTFYADFLDAPKLFKKNMYIDYEFNNDKHIY